MFDLIERPPFSVGAGELQFIAILVNMLGAEDRGDLRQFDFTDTGEVVDDLLLFVLELCLVGQDLPFASSATIIKAN